MKIQKVNTVSAVIGVAAVIALATLAVALPAPQVTADTVDPVSHFGDPVDTSINVPTMELGVPLSSPATVSPLNAPAPQGTVLATP